MRKPKKRIRKAFKGYVKLPLRDYPTEQEMLANTQWFGEWKYKGSIILSKRRIYYINMYVYLLDGTKDIINITSPNHLTMEQLKPLLEYALAQTKEYTNIDYDKSYITVSC